MANIAQQDHLYIMVDGFEELTDTEKATLRRACIRKTINDVILVQEGASSNLERKVLGANTPNVVGAPCYIYVYNTEEEAVVTYNLGNTIASDYTDDTPSPDVNE